jgi:phosphonopyruvate decarboxylase
LQLVSPSKQKDKQSTKSLEFDTSFGLEAIALQNSINPLISICHSKVYSIPLILMIGWRGSPKENDEPQHQLKGKITPSILKLLNIKFSVLNNFGDLKKIKKLINYSKYEKRPVAFLVKNNTLSLDVNFEKDNEPKNYLTREVVIKNLLKNRVTALRTRASTNL